MSRHNYSDDIDEWALIKWRGQVASAIRGKRGQRLLLDLIAALDAMPEKALIAQKLIDHEDGDAVCALGAVGVRRGIAMDNLDPEEPETVAGVIIYLTTPPLRAKFSPWQPNRKHFNRQSFSSQILTDAATI